MVTAGAERCGEDWVLLRGGGGGHRDQGDAEPLDQYT